MNSWYVYLLTTGRDTLYTGISVSPARRIRQHRGELKGGAKALRGKGPLNFYCIFEVESRSQALILEAWIKNRSRPHKIALRHQLETLPVAATQLSDVTVQRLNEEHR